MDKRATITLEVTIYDTYVECYAKGHKRTNERSGTVIKTTPYMAIYGPGTVRTPIGDTEDKSLKQAILEATEPQIDFAMDDLDLTADTTWDRSMAEHEAEYNATNR